MLCKEFPPMSEYVVQTIENPLTKWFAELYSFAENAEAAIVSSSSD